MLQKFVSFITTDPRKHRAHGGDSSSDRLSCVYTYYILIGFAAVTQFGQLLWTPVQCWCPAHFTDSHVDYANSVCWTSNTYQLPFTEEIPKEEEEDKQDYISYYQWVGLMLALQAILFHTPRVIWRTMNRLSGMPVATITDAAIECQMKSSPENRQSSIKFMVNHMGRFLLQLKHSPTCLATIRGHYITTTYIFIKLPYFAYVLGQLYLLNAFLDTNFNAYGIEIAKKMIANEPWLNSKRFPKVTLCNFKTRLLGNVHRHTIQCSLPLNLFNEIIFIFVWCLFVVVAAVTAISFVAQLLFVCSSCTRKSYIQRRLVSFTKDGQQPSK